MIKKHNILKIGKKLSLFLLLGSFFFSLNLSANETYKMNYDKQTRGLIRKLPVYKNPLWVAKVITKDSKEFYFVSPKSMLEFYYNAYKWEEETNIKSKDDLKEIIVTDYKTSKPIDAKYAFYVYGTNKISLAGDDLPAFENINDAKKFMKENNGRRVLSFSQLSNGLIQLLNGDI